MAIAFDNSTDFSFAAASPTRSLSYTVGSGANRKLIVGIDIAFDVLSTVTYNGSALTLDQKLQDTANAYNYWLHLDNPSSGSNTLAVTVTLSGSVVSVMVVSYSGMATGAPEAIVTATGAGGSISQNITTVTAGAWVVAYVATHSGGTIGAGTGAIINNYGAAGTYQAMGDTGNVASPSTISVGFSDGGLNANDGMIAGAVAPFGGGSSRGLFQPSPVTGIGSGGSGYFRDPLGAPMVFSRRNHIYVPSRMAA